MTRGDALAQERKFLEQAHNARQLATALFEECRDEIHKYIPMTDGHERQLERITKLLARARRVHHHALAKEQLANKYAQEQTQPEGAIA